jgi:hypothetical protein
MRRFANLGKNLIYSIPLIPLILYRDARDEWQIPKKKNILVLTERGLDDSSQFSM